MAVFRRRNNQTNVPAEIQEYYQTERRERAGVAWLLALGTLLVTVVLAVGLFFGSRWVYRQVANDKPSTAQNDDQETEQQQGEQQPAANNSQNDAQNNQQAEADRKAAEEKKKQEEAKKQEDAKKQADAKAAEEQKKKDEEAKKQAEAQQNAHSSSQHVASTQTNNNIPNTGAEDTLAVFMILVLAGYVIHRILINAAAARRR